MAKYRKRAFELALIYFALFFCGCEQGNFKALNAKEQGVGFAYDGLEETLRLKEEAKPFALVFFTKDCGVCVEQIKIIEALRKDYEFDFFAVLADAKDEQDALNWAKQKNLTFMLLYEKRAASYLSKAVGGIYGVPVSAFFSKQGEKKGFFIGLSPYSLLQKELLSLM